MDSKRRVWMIGMVVVLVLAAGAVFVSAKWYSGSARLVGISSADKESQEIQDSAEAAVAALRRRLEKDPAVGWPEDGKLRILLLGLDTRRGSSESHCDAIHFFTLDPGAKSITITSVPRGTYAFIPGVVDPTQTYLANACAMVGLEYGIEQIERIVGAKQDYSVTVNFSQAIGLLRALDLPTVETLQWLRHRQSYAIGDPQRSANQATFLKDLLTRSWPDASFVSEYLLYAFVNTDMEFGTARAVGELVRTFDLATHPDRVILEMKPSFVTQELHFDLKNPQAQIEEIEAFLRPIAAQTNFTGRSVAELQAVAEAYLQSRLDADGSVADVVEGKWWLQLESEEKRKAFEWQFTKRYAWQFAKTSVPSAVDLITFYVLEQEAIGDPVYAENGKALLRALLPLTTTPSGDRVGSGESEGS